MKNARNLRGMGQYGTIGIEMVLSMLVGLWIGTKLDEKLGTAPWMAVLWFFFGCAAAGRTVYRAWKGMQVEAKREEEQEGNPAQAFPDEKSIAWQREEDRKAREIREAALEGEIKDLENAEGGAKVGGTSAEDDGAEAPDEVEESKKAEKRDG